MENLEDLKAKIDIVDVVGSYIKLKKEGTEYVAKCPFHNEKTGSFKVSKAKDIYKCFGCGKSGDAIAFVMEYENKSFVDAVDILAKKYNVEVQLGSKKEFIKPLPRLEKLGKKALSWFENDRKISNYTLLELKITEASEFMPQLNQEVNAICFNYYRGEDLVNIKFRGPKKSFKLAKDAELIFYNLNAIKDEDTAVIVEGEIDCLTLHECGIRNVVSVPNGANKGNQRLEYLDNCWEYFMRLKKVVIATDNDEPGRMLKEELARRIGKDKCWQVSFPEDCKDANDILCKYGKDAVKELIEQATEWPLEGVISTEDMLGDIMDWYKDGYPKGANSHIPGFNDLLTFAPGQLTVITGIPGHGKDEFANWIMTSLARSEQWKWAVCGFEEEPPFTATKLMEKFVGKSFAFRRNTESRMSQTEFERSVLLVDDYFHFINIQQIDATMDGILKKAEELVKRKGIKGIIINPWNCLEHKVPFGYSETQYISEELTRLINFLMKYGVHGFLIAHPTKMQKNMKTKKYDVPTLYNISGSAHFYNKTHNGICVYRDFETNNVEVYVQKVKWSWLGQTGWSSYSFNTETREYNFLGCSVVKKSNQFPDGNWKKVNQQPIPAPVVYAEPTEPEDELPF